MNLLLILLSVLIILTLFLMYNEFNFFESYESYDPTPLIYDNVNYGYTDYLSVVKKSKDYYDYDYDYDYDYYDPHLTTSLIGYEY